MATIRLATWNVNGIRARLDDVATWVAEHVPDVVLLQETKVEDRLFPRVPFLELGYSVTCHGSKGYAGVATLSRSPPTEIHRGFRDPPHDDHCRMLHTVVTGVRIWNLYVPNGKALGTENFRYKLEWLAHLRTELDRHARPDEPIVVGGDFNIAPDERDVWDPLAMRGRIHFSDSEHAALKALTDFGLYDCFRKMNGDGGHFTWFDYRTGGFARGEGLRIDHVYASAPLYQRCVEALHDTTPRAGRNPSDHLPVVVRFD